MKSVKATQKEITSALTYAVDIILASLPVAYHTIAQEYLSRSYLYGGRRAGINCLNTANLLKAIKIVANEAEYAHRGIRLEKDAERLDEVVNSGHWRRTHTTRTAEEALEDIRACLHVAIISILASTPESYRAIARQRLKEGNLYAGFESVDSSLLPTSLVDAIMIVAEEADCAYRDLASLGYKLSVDTVRQMTHVNKNERQ